MNKYNKEKFEEVIKKSFSYSSTCKNIGLVPVGGNILTVKKYIKLYNINIDHFTGQGWNFGDNYKQTKNAIPLNDILDGLHPSYGTTHLKKRLIKDRLKENRCEECGLTEWNNMPIALQLHHKDGDSTNHKFENLKILCPNCHTQTDTYGSKNKGTEKTYDKIQLLESISNSKNYSEVKIKIGLKRGGDNNVIKNIMFEYDINFNDSEKIKSIILEEKELIEKELIEKEEIQNKSTKKIKIRKKYPSIKNICSCGKEIQTRSNQCNECYRLSERKVMNRPTKDELRLMISDTSLEAVGRVYGVTGNTVKKWLK
jgi:hypothetical protein